MKEIPIGENWNGLQQAPYVNLKKFRCHLDVERIRQVLVICIESIDASIPALSQLNDGVDYHGEDNHEPQGTEYELNNRLLFQVKEREWHDNDGKDRERHVVGVETARVLGRQHVVKERIFLADLNSSDLVEGDVHRPRRTGDGGERPPRQEIVKTQDDEVSVLKVLVEKNLAQFRHLELSELRNFEPRMFAGGDWWRLAVLERGVQ